jgi:hypothetical protein
MYQYDDPTAAATLPTPAAPGTAGYFTDGSPGSGIPATILRSDFNNMLMMELLNVVTAGGLTPSKTTYNQVLLAIKALGAGGQLGAQPNGQCRLSAAGTASLLLSPYNGNNIIVNGVPQQIPAAGVSLSNSGLQGQVSGSSFSIASNVCTYNTGTAHGLVVGARASIQNNALGILNGNWIVASVPNSTQFTFAITNANVSSTPDTGATIKPVYYAYVAMVSGSMALLADQIGYTIQANGIATKTGDVTKALVGMFMLNPSNQFQGNAGAQFVLNWFNRRKLMAVSAATPAANFTNTSTTEVTSVARTAFLCWADDTPSVTAAGTMSQSTTATITSALCCDAVTNAIGPVQNQTFTGTYSSGFSTNGTVTSGEGLHATLFCAYVNSGTGLLTNIQTDVSIVG